MRSDRPRVALRAGALVLALVVAVPAAQPARPTVALVKSGPLPPFEVASSAIVASLASRSPQPEVLTFDLAGDEATTRQVLETLRAASPDLIVTVGSLATAAVLKEAPRAPVVFSMVLYPDQSGFRAGRGGVTGASLDIPPDVQFDWIHRILPAARRVGVLFDQTETGGVIEAARKAARARGLTLVAREVSEAAGAPGALAALMEDVDVVWAVADSHVFTPQTTPELILASLRRGVPLLGLSAAHVRSGALGALYCDYADVGRQTGELAGRVLDGERAEALAVTVPRHVDVALNLKTAEHLGVHVPADVAAQAGVTIQ